MTKSCFCVKNKSNSYFFKGTKMSLSEDHVKDICLIGKGSDECRYLNSAFTNNKPIYICQKKSINKSIIDNEIKEFCDECKSKGLDPKFTNSPLGNNCNGFLPLTNLAQGYDVK